MNTAERTTAGFWRLGEAVRLGVRAYLAENPLPVLATTAWPRVLLQCLFLTLLGLVGAGTDGERYAFVGAAGVVVTLYTTVGVADIPALEKWSGTFYRIHTGRLHPVLVFAARTVPHIVESLFAVCLCLLVIGPLTGNGDLSLRLVPMLPLYAVIILTSTAAGLAGAAVAAQTRSDELVGNGLSYLIMVAGGVVIPPGRTPWLDAVGSVLPVRNGLLAVHSQLAGQVWLPHLLAELLVGLAWAVLAWLAFSWQARRARHRGDGDFI